MRGKGEQELSLEWLKLEKLISDFEFNEYVLNAVIRRESADKIVAKGVAVPDSGYAMHSTEAYSGYSLLIRAYMALNIDSLSEQQTEKLIKAHNILEALRQQVVDIYLLNSSAYSTYKTTEKARIIAQLEATGEVYTRGGYLKAFGSGHHAIIKYNKVGDIYYRTEFNEGSGAERLTPPGNQKHGWGVNRRAVNRKNIEEVIGIDVDNFFSSKPKTEKILPLLEPRSKEDIDQSIITTLQNVGNCNTRSIRSLLRLIIGQKMLRELYEVATTPLPEIQIQLVEKFEDVQDKLKNLGTLESLTANRHELRTKPDYEGISPQISRKNLDITQIRLKQLADSIIRQAEHILQGTLQGNHEMETFKRSLFDALEFHYGEIGVEYLKQESITKIAFIIAESLIENKVILASKKPDSQHNEIYISSTSETRRFIYDGILKSVANADGCENELGIDITLSKRASKLVKTLHPKYAEVNITTSKLIAVVKIMLNSLAKPYRIDGEVLEIIERNLRTTIIATLKPPFALRKFLANYTQIINATKTKLEQNTTLKLVEKDKLLQPSAKRAIGKLRISRHTDLAKMLAKRESERIKAILDKEEPVTSQFLTEAMRFAIEYEDKPLSDRLLNRGVDINTQDKDGDTLLMNAVRSEDLASIKTLFAAGADPSLKNKQGNDATLMALSGGRNDILFAIFDKEKELTEHESQRINAILDKGEPVTSQFLTEAMKFAIKRRDKPLSDRLLVRGADINTQDEGGQTLLMAAIWKYDLASVKELLAAGADPSLKNKQGKTALSMAIDFEYSTIVKEIFDQTKGSPNLQKISVGITDKPSETILHTAVSSSNTYAIDIIVKCLKGSPGVLKSLLRAKDSQGRTAFEASYQDGKTYDSTEAILESVKDHPDLLKGLFEKKNKDGKTTFQEAVETNPKLALLFLKYGAQPDLSMVMRNVASPELQQAIRAKYLGSLAPSTGAYESISKGLPDVLKKLVPGVFPPKNRNDDIEK